MVEPGWAGQGGSHPFFCFARSFVWWGAAPPRLLGVLALEERVSAARGKRALSPRRREEDCSVAHISNSLSSSFSDSRRLANAASLAMDPSESASSASDVLSAEELRRFIPLDFTYVVYDRSQHHSVALAYLTFLPILVGFGLINAVLLRRDLECLYHAVGLALSSAINFVLKRLLSQARPAGSHKLGYGMPSDHAQFSWFFVTYSSWWILRRARLTERQRRLSVAGLITGALVVCWSRVHLGVHTSAQVLVGSVLGVGLGAMWAWWAGVCVWTHIFPLLERSPLGRRLHFKDCSHLPPGVTSAHQFEYEMYTRGRTAAPTATAANGESTAIACGQRPAAAASSADAKKES